MCFFVLIWAGGGSIKKTPASVTDRFALWIPEALGIPAEGYQTPRLDRNKAVTAPRPQVQPLARLSRHVHGHAYTTRAQIYTWLATLINTDRCSHKQYQWPHPAPLPDWWRSIIGKYTYPHVYEVDPAVAGLVFAAAVPRLQSPQLLASGCRSRCCTDPFIHHHVCCGPPSNWGSHTWPQTPLSLWQLARTRGLLQRPVPSVVSPSEMHVSLPPRPPRLLPD